MYLGLTIKTNSVLRLTQYPDRLNIQTDSITRLTQYPHRLNIHTDSISRLTQYLDWLNIHTDSILRPHFVGPESGCTNRTSPYLESLGLSLNHDCSELFIKVYLIDVYLANFAFSFISKIPPEITKPLNKPVFVSFFRFFFSTFYFKK